MSLGWDVIGCCAEGGQRRKMRLWGVLSPGMETRIGMQVCDLWLLWAPFRQITSSPLPPLPPPGPHFPFFFPSLPLSPSIPPTHIFKLLLPVVYSGYLCGWEPHTPAVSAPLEKLPSSWHQEGEMEPWGRWGMFCCGIWRTLVYSQTASQWHLASTVQDSVCMTSFFLFLSGVPLLRGFRGGGSELICLWLSPYLSVLYYDHGFLPCTLLLYAATKGGCRTVWTWKLV